MIFENRVSRSWLPLFALAVVVLSAFLLSLRAERMEAQRISAGGWMIKQTSLQGFEDNNALVKIKANHQPGIMHPKWYSGKQSSVKPFWYVSTIGRIIIITLFLAIVIVLWALVWIK